MRWYSALGRTIKSRRQVEKVKEEGTILNSVASLNAEKLKQIP
jgi:hypothetical protein